jgi:hypothetical protein
MYMYRRDYMNVCMYECRTVLVLIALLVALYKSFMTIVTIVRL